MQEEIHLDFVGDCEKELRVIYRTGTLNVEKSLISMASYALWNFLRGNRFGSSYSNVARLVVILIQSAPDKFTNYTEMEEEEEEESHITIISLSHTH